MSDVFSKSLADDLPWEDIVDDVLIFSDGSVGIGYEMIPVYVDSMSFNELMELQNTLCAFLSGIEKGISVQVVWSKRSVLKALDSHMNQVQSGDPLLQMMTEGREDYWCEQRDKKEVFGIQCQIWFRKNYPRELSKPFNSIWSLGIDSGKYIEKYTNEQMVIADDFKRRIDRMVGFLYTLQGVKIHRMSTQEIFSSLWSFFTNDDVNIPHYSYSTPLKDKFSGIDVSRNWGYLSVGNSNERIINVLTMRDLPENSKISFINYMLSMPIEFSLVMNIETIEQGEIRNKLRKQMRRYESVIFSRLAPEESVRASAVAKLLHDLESTNNQLVKFEMSVILKDNRLESISNKVKYVIDIGLSKMQTKFEQEKAALWQVYKSIIPSACRCGTVQRDFIVKTVNVSNFMPVLGPIQSAGRSIMLMGGQYKTLYGYDPFDGRLPAAHALVIGGTGSGKSFMTNMLLLSTASQNPMIFIVDKGGSYKRFTKMLGGAYIDLSTPGISFNPLEGKKTWREREKSINQILLETLRSSDGTTDDFQAIIVQRWVQAIYEKFNHDPELTDKEPTFSDAYEILMKNKMYDTEDEMKLSEIQKDIQMKFSLWTRLGTKNKSAYARILDNEQTNVSVDNDIIAFDLFGIEKAKELMNVIFLTINNIILSKVSDVKELQRPKIIVFDEVWSLLKSEEGASFLEELYRTMRKYNAMVLSISQDIEDFSNSDVANALLGNTYQMIILRQSSDSNAEKIAGILGLNRSEEELVASLTQIPGEYSEVFLKLSGVGSGKMSVRPSPIEYWFATTKAEDKAVIENYQNQGYTLSDALKILSEKYPHGITYKS